ncbi:MAG: hypothetical protein EXR67_00140 [Dehalococcoidia bacterium]|nr:hypothetical protein [Dehalococcoidia bacterium]
MFLAALALACGRPQEVAAPAPSAKPAAAPTAAPVPAPAPGATPAAAPTAPAAPAAPQGPQPLVPGGPVFYRQEFESSPAGQFLRDYDFRKWPLWTKASYGGELRGAGGGASLTPMLSFLTTQAISRMTVAGMLLLLDEGVCSMIGRDADFSTCNGQYSRSSDVAIVPGLIVKWEQPDPLTFNLTVRKGALWPAVAPMTRTDREVTAEDIAWFLDITKKEGIIRDNLALAQSFTAVDRYTVRVKMSAPQAEFIHNLTNLSMGTFPKECYDEKGCLGGKQISPAPFLLKESVAQQRTVYEKNPEFWMKGLPYLDRIVALAITDTGAQKAALSTGQIDMVGFQGVGEAALLTKQTPGARMQTEAILQGTQSLEPKYTGPFADVRVRRAMAMAMDHKTIWSAAEGFNWFPTITPRHLFGPVGPNAPYAFQISLENQVSEWYKFNPAKAKALLAEAGYANGFKTEMTTSTCSGANYDMLLVLQANWLKYLNVDASMKCIDAAAYTVALNGNKWGDGILYVRQQSLTLCGCVDLAMARMVTGATVNFQKMSDPVIDDFFNKQRGELDPAKRVKILWDYEQYEMNQVYVWRMAWTWGVMVKNGWEINCAGHELAYCGPTNGPGWLSMMDPATYPKNR